jgi:hypothetical protein
VEVAVAAALMQLAVALAAASEPDDVAQYALVVGSNLGGPGQAPLQYADDDARNVADVLVELGGYDPADVQLLFDPDPGTLLEALASLAERVAEERRQDERVVATFYYSGHSRATALDLGGEELALTKVREVLQGVDATLTLVVLDACQSGALSRSKGVEPAADFSGNSVRGLDTEGFVVLASSSASELSQESDDLRGSTFTHHLVSGLRGAADRGRDGVVTLDEAYAYAYDRTVYTTAQTALGQQHPALELDVSGHGGTVLTRPARSSAILSLPAEMQAEMVLVRADTGAVVAELHKAGEEPLELALVPADYIAITKRGGSIERCRFAVEPDTTTVYGEGAQCSRVAAVSPSAKYARRELGLAFEAGLGGMSPRRDTFITQLGAFGFMEDEAGRGPLLWELAAAWSFRRHLSLVATLGDLEQGGLVRRVTSPDGTAESSYRWSSTRWTASLRGNLPLEVPRLGLYAQIGLGPILVSHTLVSLPLATDRQWKLGYHLASSAGVQLQLLPWLGTYAQAGGSYAPALRNELGETHDLGGWGALAGLRVTP